MNAPTKQERQDAVEAAGYWFHSIDVGEGVVTPGAKSMADHDDEWRRLAVPDLTGRTVLDIGAWDGRYSFEAEQAGAARVVALDHYSWSVDFLAFLEFVAGCHARGERVPDAMTVPGIWDPETLPGKKGFDLARRLRGSKVEDVVLDFSNDDLSSVGQFDVVLFAGVLYHLADPVNAMRRVYSLTKEMAIVSTHGVRIGGFEDRALGEFFPHDEFAGDPTNWWVPNLKGLIGWCEAAGFRRFEVKSGPNENVQLAPGESDTFIAVVHAYR